MRLAVLQEHRGQWLWGWGLGEPACWGSCFANNHKEQTLVSQQVDDRWLDHQVTRGICRWLLRGCSLSSPLEMGRGETHVQGCIPSSWTPI